VAKFAAGVDDSGYKFVAGVVENDNAACL